MSTIGERVQRVLDAATWLYEEHETPSESPVPVGDELLSGWEAAYHELLKAVDVLTGRDGK